MNIAFGMLPMVIASRILLIAILLVWQLFPAASHGDVLGIPASRIVQALADNSKNDPTSAWLDESCLDFAEVADQRPPVYPTLLALVPDSERITLPDYCSEVVIFSPGVTASACTFLFRDRGPPLQS
jgi:hypothetical protein